MPLTSDPNDPRLTHGPDSEPQESQAEVYLVLSEEERDKGFVRPVRYVYRHTVCGSETRMGRALAETYAAQPHYYGSTWCCACRMHRLVGIQGEFEWLDGSKVGS